MMEQVHGSATVSYSIVGVKFSSNSAVVDTSGWGAGNCAFVLKSED